MGLRNFLKGERLTKSLEPTKCALCGGEHSKLEVMMTCGDCHDGLFNYMGGNDEFASLFGPRNRITPGGADMTEPTAGSAKTQGSAARADKLKGAGLDNPPGSPTAQAVKEGPKSGVTYERSEEPSTHSSTNSSRAHS